MPLWAQARQHSPLHFATDWVSRKMLSARRHSPLSMNIRLLTVRPFFTSIFTESTRSKRPQSRLSRTAKLTLAVTIHNFPEGMAVGVALAGALTADFNVAGALALSLGIAIQNIPEGAIISMPLRAAGNSRWKSFCIGTLSGIVEPIGGGLVLFLATSILGIMPYMLAFAAGAMLYVVVEELVPEYSQGEHSNIGTIGFALGFALMMVLDVVLG